MQHIMIYEYIQYEYVNKDDEMIQLQYKDITILCINNINTNINPIVDAKAANISVLSYPYVYILETGRFDKTLADNEIIIHKH